MPTTYEPISTTTLTSNTTPVTFSSIPQTYTDLVLILNLGSTPSAQLTRMRFNGDAATNYSDTKVRGNGTTAYSTRISSDSEITLNEFAYASTTLGKCNIIVNFMNYTNTTTYKTILFRSNNADLGTELGAGLWRSTAAISTIEVFNPGNNFLSGSTFTLYGIKAA